MPALNNGNSNGPAVVGGDVSLLLVEDEAALARALAKRMEKAGYRCHIAGRVSDAWRQLEVQLPDMCILDLRLPDGSGLDLLARIRERLGPGLPVLILSAYGEIEDAVAAMKLNATDFLRKPVDLDELLLTVEKVLRNAAGFRQLEYSLTREQQAGTNAMLLGEHPSIVALRTEVEQIGSVLSHAEGIPPTVLILGETGSGKDVTARLLHASSARRGRPFVHVDCAALPKDLIEAELFGHDKGAFTSAVAARAGLIEAAEDGVVFLDEIAELPLELQAKLLAVLERRVLRRVGSSHERPVRAWFIAATNRDVQEMVRTGNLRSDLFYRLNVLTLTVPALRNRGQDVELLAKHFLSFFARRYGVQAPTLLPDAVRAMTHYGWPGNVRELRHLMERATLIARGGRLDAQGLLLPDVAGPGEDAAELAAAALEHLTLDGAERLLIEKALQRTGNNVSEAARQLGVTRMAMRYRMQKYQL